MVTFVRSELFHFLPSASVVKVRGIRPTSSDQMKRDREPIDEAERFLLNYPGTNSRANVGASTTAQGTPSRNSVSHFPRSPQWSFCTSDPTTSPRFPSTRIPSSRTLQFSYEGTAHKSRVLIPVLVLVRAHWYEYSSTVVP